MYLNTAGFVLDIQLEEADATAGGGGDLAQGYGVEVVVPGLACGSLDVG